jgi:hypothetical protein
VRKEGKQEEIEMEMTLVGEKGRVPEKIRQKERKNRGEREMELPKDLCVKSENCRDLFVKQNFPLI